MIDRQTVERIKEAANIVEVVSEFVTLRKSGANYKGLCPFHNEKTPSFIVSPARGTCHCFGCGKGGNAVSFIMEHEQLTYPEALRWLARKYHIEIQERELTDEERRQQSERESMFIVNEWAAGYFNDLLRNHPDGQAVGLQYFRSRGIRDDIISKFQLGYDLSDRRALAATARAKGYKDDYLVKTGLCYRNDRGELIDRFAGRVIFPWVGVSGKVVGFGGRVLDSRTKGVAQKYVNSPDSEIYHKERELYGLYQAKRAIAKEDRVYMVEGYTDVIAMHQCGIENVVANSGTALSKHQINILHRFTQNITLLYDGDAAGQHAALRGTDMLLEEGMNLKVLLLPDGDDPDSFARKHTAADFRSYIEEHQTDFMQFKVDLLLRNETDPLKRSEAITSIVKSISQVQNPILRDTYLRDCSQRMGIAEATLIAQMNQFIREKKGGQTTQNVSRTAAPNMQKSPISSEQSRIEAVETLLVGLVIRKGEQVIFTNLTDDDGQTFSLNVAQYVAYDMAQDGLKFADDRYNRILQEAVEHSSDEDFVADRYFVNHEDIELSRLAVELSTDRYANVKIASDDNEGPLTDEEQEKQRDDLRRQTQHLMLDYRMEIAENKMNEVKKKMRKAGNDLVAMKQLMEEYKELQQVRNGLARALGSNIII